MSIEKTSSVKRFFPDFHQSSAHQTPFMREAENGVYVDYAEYQRLETTIQKARIQGIKYARNRLIAAHIHGWIDKPDSEVRDICQMLNSAASELKNEASDDWVSETFGDEWLEAHEVRL